MIFILTNEEARALGMKPGPHYSGVKSHTVRRAAEEYTTHTFELHNPIRHLLEPLKDLGNRSTELARQKGFGSEDSQAMSVCRIALMHQELSEMLEAVRKPSSADGKPPMSDKVPQITLEAEEAADLFIRLSQYCTIRGINLDLAVDLKHEYNKTRPYKHGKLF